MDKTYKIKEVDQVEILTLADNYVDLTSMDSNEIVTRATPIKDMALKGCALAEHGFAALVKTVVGEDSHMVMFDFGLSDIAALYNARMLDVDLSGVEAAALSHGHMDHFGSLIPVMEAIPEKPVPLYLHPGAFLKPRFIKIGDIRIGFPPPDRAAWEEAGAEIVESEEPRLLAGDTVLFLGEVERTTEFEKGMPNAYYEKDGEDIWDPIVDDTGIAMNLRGKGLVVLSGCSHSGIVNTVSHARKVSGVDDVHVIMGGFHLSGPAFEPIIDKTIDGLAEFEPDYVIPTHCTGRKAILTFEEAMPEKFIVNMCGTRLTFRA